MKLAQAKVCFYQGSLIRLFTWYISYQIEIESRFGMNDMIFNGK